MLDRPIDEPRSGAGRRLARLLVGGVLVGGGVFAFSHTLRYAYWWLWWAVWPLMVLAAGVLLLLFGGRHAAIGGLVLIGFGLVYLVGTLGTLTWQLMSVFWPGVLILVGLAIVGAGLRRQLD